MKKTGLTALYEKKTILLKELLSLQDDQLRYLNFSQPEKAVKLSGASLKIVAKMELIDKQLEKTSESLPGTSGLIELADTVFRLTEEARLKNDEIALQMDKYLMQTKSDYTTVSVKRQVREHLQKPERLWKTGTC